MILSLIIMAAMMTAPEQVKDGDRAYYRVDTRLPAHELPAGTLADAVNKMLPDGRAWPRPPVNRQAWGIINNLPNLVPVGTYWTAGGGGISCSIEDLAEGQAYVIFLGNADGIGWGVYGTDQWNPLATANGQVFIAPRITGTIYTIYAINQAVFPGLCTAQIYRASNVCGYGHFVDPSGYDTGILLTDDWRQQAGEDGGRGRAWRILPGNIPAQIPMNGNDIWDTARLIPCLAGVVMLRQGDERHYFSAGSVQVTGGGDSIIQLNCEPDWDTADEVYLWADEGSAFEGGSGVQPNALYYVKNIGNNQIELYGDQALAHQLTWAGAVGRFFLERRAAFPGFWGNGAPPLLAQPDVDGNPWNQVGFLAVPEEIFIGGYDAGTKAFTAPNHNFVPGQAVKYWSVTGNAFSAFYVYVLDANHIQLMAAQADALNGVNAAAIPAAYNAADYVQNATASGQPMPPGREGAWVSQRLVIANGLNNIAISDPNDPLHFTLLSQALTANVGVGGQTNGFATVSSQDTLIILNNNAVLALYFFSEGSGNWVLRNITTEYGCVAALTIVSRGPSTMFLSARGYDRVIETALGVIQPTVNPVSYDMKKYIGKIDWKNVARACACMVNNRLLLAIPQSAQAAPVQNNLVLSLNFENSDLNKDQFAWEGVWTGAALLPYAMASLTVNGQPRFSFADNAGNVNWLGDGWLDLGLNAIADSMTTRIYSGGSLDRKIWRQTRVVWDQNGAKVTVAAQTPGYNESQVLAPCPIVYDRTQYVAGEGADYDPATQQPPFGAPYREDYSLAGPGELIGGVPDAHQNIPETFYPRADDWGVQIVIANAAGSLRVGQVEVTGTPGPRAASRSV